MTKKRTDVPKLKTVWIVAKELHNYDQEQSASHKKKQWEEIDYWKKIYYRVQARKILIVIKRARQKMLEEMKKNE